MKKIIGILSHRRAMAEFYGEIFQELFKDFAEIFVAAAEDDSIRGMPEADLYISSVTSYDLRGNSELREFINGELKPIEFDEEGNMLFGQRPEEGMQPMMNGERPELPEGEMPQMNGGMPGFQQNGFGQPGEQNPGMNSGIDPEMTGNDLFMQPN